MEHPVIIFKPNGFLLFFLYFVFIASGIKAQQAIEFEDDSSGKTRIAEIMFDSQEGVYRDPCVQNVSYAQTNRALAEDLNVGRIADFFGCKTFVGTTFLEDALKRPINSSGSDSLIMDRQRAIKALVENPELKKQVDQLIRVAAEYEHEVVTLMADHYVGKACPERIVLEDSKNKDLSFAYTLKERTARSSTFRTIGSAYETLVFGACGVGTVFFASCIPPLIKSGAPAAVYGPVAGLSLFYSALTAFQGFNLYKDYSSAAEKRLKVHALYQLVSIAQKIEQVATDNGLNMQSRVSSVTDPDGVALIASIQHKRYKYKNTKMFITSLVHTFLFKLYDNDRYLAQIFASIAEMDAYNAIATKIIEHSLQENKLCFVTFASNNRSVINAEGLWNVLVEKPVLNSIQEDKSIILTGPNAGGKTTSIRSILQNIVLGQTFGIAAAHSCECSLFDIIHTYLNVSDDLVNGLSLFASEVKRAQTILEQVKSLKPGQKFFFALDELFTGTVTADGEICAYSFVRKLSEFDGVQFIYATHFEKLQELGNEHIFFANYKVGAPTKNEAGKLVYPFTLSRGVNESRVAMDIAREAHLFD